MREIKFRAWAAEPKQMMQLFEYPASEEESYFSVNVLVGSYGEAIIPMQYTGMKDKNEKEIFEGDIVTDGDQVREVYFNDDVESPDYSHCVGWGIPWMIDRTNMEVIGNIYENPELREE